MIKTFHKLKNKLPEFLQQGATPHELALAIALGMVIGMFPVQGTTTVICTLIAVIFRLNLVVIQLANYLSIPLMMIMIIPLYVVGHELFNSGAFHWGVEELLNLFNTDFWGAISLLSWSVLYAIIVWLFFAPIGMLIIYLISVNIIKRTFSHTSG
jgi:hypothetical protein